MKLLSKWCMALAGALLCSVSWAAYTATPVYLFDAGPTATEGWTSLSKNGSYPEFLTADTTYTSGAGGEVSFSSNSAGNFFNVPGGDEYSMPSNGFTGNGTYVGLDGTSYGTIFEEMAATLGLESIPDTVWNDALCNGGYNGHTVTLTGLNSAKTYVMYLISGANKSETAGAFTLDVSTYRGPTVVDYVCTVADSASGTTVATEYQRTTFGSNIATGTDGYVLVRVSNFSPNSDGQIKFTLSGGRSQINAVAIAEIEPVAVTDTRTLGVIGINFASNEAALSTGETLLGFESDSKGGKIALTKWNAASSARSDTAVKTLTVTDVNGNTYPLIYSSAGSYFSSADTSVEIGKLTKGYLDVSAGGKGVDIILHNLPASGYDVAIIASGDGNSFAPFTVNGTQYTAVDSNDDGTADTTAVGSTAWGTRAGATSLIEGVNVLYIPAQTDTILSIQGGDIGANARASLAGLMIFPKAFTAKTASANANIAYSALTWTDSKPTATDSAVITLAAGVTLTINETVTATKLEIVCEGDCGIVVNKDCGFGTTIVNTDGVTGTLTTEYISYTGTIVSNTTYSGTDSALTGAIVANTTITGSGTLTGDFVCDTPDAKLTIGGSYTATVNTLIGGSNGEVEIATGANITVPHLRFVNYNDTSDSVELNVNGTLNISSTSSQANVWGERDNYMGSLFGHYHGQGVYNVNAGGKFLSDNAYIQIVYTAEVQTLNVNGGEVKVRGIQANNTNGSVTLSNGGKLSLAEGFLNKAIAQSYGYGTISAYSYNDSTGWTSSQPATVTDTTNGTTIDPNGLTIAFTGAISGEGKIIVNDQSEAKNGTVTLSDLENHTGEIEVFAGNLTLTDEQVLAAEKITATGGTLTITLSDESYALGTTFDKLTINGGTVTYKYGETTVFPDAEDGTLIPAHTPTWVIPSGTTPDWSSTDQWTYLTNNVLPTSGNIAIDFSGVDAEAAVAIEIPATAQLTNVLFLGAAVDATLTNKCELSVTLATDATVASVTAAGNVTLPLAVVNACTGDVIVDEGYVLSVDVGDGTEEVSLTKAITGAGAWAKTGTGTLLLNAEPHTTGGNIIAAGTLKYGSAVLGGTGNAYAEDGDKWQDVVVYTGATLDMNGVPDARTKTITLKEGATFANGSTTGVGTRKRQLWKIVLEGDATIHANAQFSLNSAGNNNTFLDLADHTLTKTGDGIFDLNNTEISAGTIDIQAGTIEVSNGLDLTGEVKKTGAGLLKIVTASSGGTLKVNGGEVKITAGTQATKYVVASGATLTTAGTFEMSAQNALSGTLDVESGNLSLNAAKENLEGTINIASGATLTMTRNDDLLDYNATVVVNVRGTLVLGETRWSLGSNNTINLYGGATVSGAGQGTHGALDWIEGANSTVNILPSAEGVTGETVTISAATRIRSGATVTWDVADGVKPTLSGKMLSQGGLKVATGTLVINPSETTYEGLITIEEGAVVETASIANLGTAEKKVAGAGNLVLATPVALDFLADTWTGKTTFAPTATPGSTLALTVKNGTTLEIADTREGDVKALAEGDTITVNGTLELKAGTLFAAISGTGTTHVTGDFALGHSGAAAGSIGTDLIVDSEKTLTLRNFVENKEWTVQDLVLNGNILPYRAGGYGLTSMLTVNGKLSGAGEIGSAVDDNVTAVVNLTLANGATLDASEGAVTVAGAVTFSGAIAATVTEAQTTDGSDILVKAGLTAPLAKVYVGTATEPSTFALAASDTGLKVVPGVASVGGYAYGDLSKALTAGAGGMVTLLAGADLSVVTIPEGVTIKLGTVSADDVKLPADYKWDSEGNLVKKDYVASITVEGTTTKYETLAEAITAATATDTITLLKGAYTEAVALTKTVTISGTATLSGAISGTGTLQTMGTITLTAANTHGGTVVESGTLKIAGAEDTTVVLPEAKTVTIEEGAVLELNKGLSYITVAGEGTTKVTGTFTFGISSGAGNNNGFDNELTSNVEVAEGATLQFRGWRTHALSVPTLTVNGTLKNDGYEDVDIVAATLTIANGNTLKGTGTIELATTFEAGAIVDASENAVTISGAVTLGSTLTVKVAEVPEAAILSATTMTGSPTGTIYVDGATDPTEDYVLEVKENALYIVPAATEATVTTEAELAAALANSRITTITVNADITIDGKHTLPAGVTVVIPEGKKVTATVNANLIIIGTINVNGTLDGSAMVYGANGLVPAQGGKVNIGAKGVVIFPTAWANAGVDPSTSDVVGTCEAGATIKIGDNEVWEKGENWAQKVAKIGTTYYATLEAAIAAANVATEAELTLLADVEVSTSIVVAKKLTLNLGTYTITPANGYVSSTVGSGLVLVQYGAELTIEGTTGAITCNGNDKVYAAVQMTTKGETYTEGKEAKLTVKGGTLKGYYYGIAGNGNRPGTDITITGGTITCYAADGIGIYHPQNGKLTVSGGEISGASAIYIKSGTVTISGGTLKAKGEKVAYNYDDNGANATGDTIVVDNCNYPGKAPTVSITGGTFESTNGKQVGSYTGNDADQLAEVTKGEGVNLTAPEGTKWDGNTLVACNYVAQVTVGDVTTKYESLADAIAALDGTGKTLTLIADAGAISIPEGVVATLDLNGYTINGGTTASVAALTNAGTLTIVDSSEAKSGTIKRTDPAKPAYYTIVNTGTMTIKQAKVTNASGSTTEWAGASLILNQSADGTEEATLNIEGGTFEQQNFIVIKNSTLGVLNVTGGTITTRTGASATGGVYSAIQNFYKATITGGTITGGIYTVAYNAAATTTISGSASVNGTFVVHIANADYALSIALNGGTYGEATKFDIRQEACGTITKAASVNLAAPEGYQWVNNTLEKIPTEIEIPGLGDDGTHDIVLANGTTAEDVAIPEAVEQAIKDAAKTVAGVTAVDTIAVASTVAGGDTPADAATAILAAELFGGVVTVTDDNKDGKGTATIAYAFGIADARVKDGKLYILVKVEGKNGGDATFTDKADVTLTDNGGATVAASATDPDGAAPAGGEKWFYMDLSNVTKLDLETSAKAKAE